MNGRNSPRHWSEHVPTILLAVAVLASPLLIGGVHAGAAAAIAAVALIGLWWTLVTTDRSRGQTELWSLSIPTVGFAVMALVCLVQLVAVPTAVHRLLQPTGHEALVASWMAAFGEAPESGWHLLSLDPRQTTGHGLRWIALAAVAALATQVTVGREKRRRWMGIILVVGVVITIAGAIQYWSGTDKILGLYEAEITPRSISPFVSTNHAATFFALMALVGIAYSLDHLRRSPLRMTLGAGATAGGIVLCAAHGSDGALLALAIGVGLLGTFVITRAAPNTGNRRARLRFAALAALGVFFVATLGSTLVPDDWTVAEEETLMDHGSAEVRLHMAGAAMEGSTDFVALGSGAGSTERVLPPYIDWHFVGTGTIPTIENEPVEWAMTLGPLAAMLALVLFGLVVGRTAPHILRRRGRRGSAVACTIAVFIGVIALFHFPFMTLGISAVAIVAIEAALDPRRDRYLYVRGTKRAFVVFALALTTALGGLLAARTTVLAPGAEQTRDVDDEEQLRRAIHLYPTDGGLFSAMSLDAGGDGDHEQALRLAQRAFEVRPHPQQEFLLAAAFAEADQRDEAALVYRSLFDADRHRHHHLFGWARPRLLYDLPTADLQASAAADASPLVMRRISSDLEDELGVMAAVDFALALVELRPHRADAHLQLVRLYRKADQDELAEMYARMLVARDLEDADGQRPAGLLFLLNLLRDQDRLTEARSIADRAFETGYGTPELGRAVLKLLPDEPSAGDRHERVYEAAFDVGCTPPYERSHRQACWQAEAFFAERDGDIDGATRHLQRIERLHGNPRPLAELLARHGRCRTLAPLRREYEGSRHRRFLDQQARLCAQVSD